MITQIIIKMFNIQKIIYKQSINWIKLIQYTSFQEADLERYMAGCLFILQMLICMLRGRVQTQFQGAYYLQWLRTGRCYCYHLFRKWIVVVGSKIFCEQNSKLNSDCACNSLPRVLCISAEILICNTEKPKYTKLFSFWAAVKVIGGEIWGKAEGGGEEEKGHPSFT